MNKVNDINICPIFVTAPSLGRQLQKHQNIPCPRNKCVCNGRSLCNRKNVTYEVKCNTCNNSYIGETHRTYRSRIMEHTKQHNSNVFKHLSSHNVGPSTDEINHEIVMGGFINSLHRKEYENKTIKNNQPTINVQYN